MPASWVEVSNHPQRSHAGGKPFASRREENASPDHQAFMRWLFESEEASTPAALECWIPRWRIKKKKEMDKLEFQPWPHGTRFKNWQTSFRREREACAAQLRHVSREREGLFFFFLLLCLVLLPSGRGLSDVSKVVCAVYLDGHCFD